MEESLLKKAKLFASYLPIIRTIAGWTSDNLASILDVSRQTISAIEKNKKISIVQYLAITRLIEIEIDSTNNQGLRFVYNYLDCREDVSEADKENFCKWAYLQIHSIGKKNGMKSISNALGSALNLLQSISKKIVYPLSVEIESEKNIIN